MKNLVRNPFGTLTFAGLALMLAVPAAQAGSSWNGGYAYPVQRDYGSRRDRGYDSRACQTSHPAHRFFDGRLYCAGKDANGCWVSDARCEDGYGHKLVNDPGFASSQLGQGCGPRGGQFGRGAQFDRGDQCDRGGQFGRGAQFDRGVSTRDGRQDRRWKDDRGESRGGRRRSWDRGDACR